jgi:hypothetical protein
MIKKIIDRHIKALEQLYKEENNHPTIKYAIQQLVALKLDLESANLI